MIKEIILKMQYVLNMNSRGVKSAVLKPNTLNVLNYQINNQIIRVSHDGSLVVSKQDREHLTCTYITHIVCMIGCVYNDIMIMIVVIYVECMLQSFLEIYNLFFMYVASF